MNLELANDLLETHGYRVVPAKGGREALEVAEREQANLILMDRKLPEMDGLEATRLLKQGESTKHIIVVALTAHAMLGDEEKAREAGCSGYLPKPINTREFTGVIAGFLGKSAEKKEG